MTKHITTENYGAGFSGTFTAEADFDTAMDCIITATGCSEESARDFLDSKHGRIFADEVSDRVYHRMELNDAIAFTTSEWMTRKTTRFIAKAYRVRFGVPMLLAFIR